MSKITFGFGKRPARLAVNVLKWAFSFFIAMFLVSCSDDGESIPDLSDIPTVDLEIRRLEQEVMAQKDKAAIHRFLEENPVLAEKYFRRRQYPNDSLLVNVIHAFTSDPHTDTLLRDVNQIFADISSLEKDLEQAFRFAQYYYPDFVVPKVYTSISGFNAFGFGNDIFLTDSMVVIGLDWYAGRRSTYRPPDIPVYMLERYEPEYIVPNIITFMSAQYNNYNYQDPTLLADMIYYGKAFHFTDKLLPYTPDSLIIGYTADEMRLSQENVEIIWAHFIENPDAQPNGGGAANALFFETAENLKNKYIGERPTVPEIADKCPGRIGRWLGWEIVRAYAKNNEEVPLAELMDIADAHKLFQQSGYKPVPLAQ